MFKIENVYVDDKKLAEFLRAVSGICRGAPHPVPVMNTDDGRTAKLNGTNMVSVFADYIVKNKIERFTPKDVQAWLAKNGRSKLSANYICKGLKKAGVVKHTGKSSTSAYTVVPRS